MLCAEVFKTIAGRLAERASEIALFVESGSCFEQWCTWEAFAACRAAGWTASPHPSYAAVGLLGSREFADLLIFDPASGNQVLVELAIVYDWTTNRWIASLNRDTGNLSRPLAPDVASLQMIMAVSLASPVEVNRTWRTWLEMTSIWKRPTKMTHTMPLGASGQMILKGWMVGREATERLSD
jgi:hypothetical protein